MNQTYIRSVGFGIALLTLLQLGCSSSGTKTTPPPVTPQITQFSASPTAVTAGQTTTITWATTNATSVTIAPAVQTGTTALATSGSATVTMTATTTFTITATASNGTTATQAVAVTVTAAPIIPVITQFTASPTDVNSGQTSTITWATTNAASVAISPAVPQSDDSGPLPTSGSSVAPILATTTYTLTATSSDGTTATATVTVTVPFTLSLSVSPATITAGSTATLSWQITGGTATSLSIDNGVCSPSTTPCVIPTGSATVKPNVTTTYTATATASDGSSITATASLTVSPAPLGVIKHIFYMLQENRSFDMYFGQLPAYRTPRLQAAGITDTSTIDVFNPSVILTNHNTGATVTPFHEKTVCTENLSPAWDESHHDVALNGGDGAWATTTTFTSSDFSMNNFLDTTNNVAEKYDPDGTRAMGYYNETDLPYYYDLASFFATSDTWHSPILANTVPNRMYLMAATSFGHEYPDNTGHPLYAAPTIFRAMNTANVSWLYYYKDGIFLSNFADFQDPKIGPKTFPVSDLLARLGGTCSGAPCNADQALPEVIFIDSASGGSGLDEHPDNNIQSGAAYVQSIISALMQSTAWYDSIFILTYDEGGGLYDHVAPFQVPEPDSYQPGHCPDVNNGSSGYCAVGKIGGQFNLTGLRVPMIVISPYAKPNFVSHVPRDYTAILAYIEKTFNVTNLTARDNYWLQNPSQDMSEFFDLTTPALLTPPAGAHASSWTTFLNPQTTGGTCDQTLEKGP
jgi:phospholipase C